MVGTTMLQLISLLCGIDCTETVKLVALLDEAKSKCKAALIERGKDKEWTEEELEKTAEAVGYGAVKYADLNNNRTTNYTFSFDQMLSDKVIMAPPKPSSAANDRK